MSPERFERIQQVLDSRQPDLTLCMDQVHKGHNLSAVVRTADAIGIHEVHGVFPEKGVRMRPHTAGGSLGWVRLHRHRTIAEAVAALRAQGMQIVVTNLSDQAKDFRDIDYTRPTALLVGQELQGISQEALDLADHQVVIPMLGMVQSLNVSVASALILYEAQRQRQNAGLYRQPRLSVEERNRVLFEQGYPALARQCKRKALPYPLIDAEGQVQADDDWWQAMRLSGASD
ncbi:tRNA (guanosine(18)-2'-O)-methyltransferase TrmH [Gallaecimonas kandeliae]|uniref:tRNA (guanosine(18)-2'-O)-methyltransferase TrmH n=1 Tax=Gallaecimonas kandeliae TaxID=3029055 RepID=UPI002647F60F|nr:tRNA (guanosine(18)-2'-O)-methyltransferase TrmH [Gallaecimonas kandeliae]WKE65775.1 tRNA (guanosine(18)-2'-O)-methyltransferase TrmH [Gallaecimonas kandeliae]